MTVPATVHSYGHKPLQFAAIAPCVRHLLAAQDMCDSVAANMQQQDPKVDLCL